MLHWLQQPLKKLRFLGAAPQRRPEQRPRGGEEGQAPARRGRASGEVPRNSRDSRTSSSVPEVRQEDHRLPVGGDHPCGLRAERGQVDGQEPGDHHLALHLRGEQLSQVAGRY